VCFSPSPYQDHIALRYSLRDTIGDLENVVVVAFFVSSVDNGTGDTVLRVE
jgi:hypothetical protein